LKGFWQFFIFAKFHFELLSQGQANFLNFSAHCSSHLCAWAETLAALPMEIYKFEKDPDSWGSQFFGTFLRFAKVHRLSTLISMQKVFKFLGQVDSVGCAGSWYPLQDLQIQNPNMKNTQEHTDPASLPCHWSDGSHFWD
jgi:hypothetical protein